MINEIISIKLMSEIFSNAEIKLKPSTQMIYQNVLNHWFSSQTENAINLASFDMFKVDVKYKNFKTNYSQLEKAGLVRINEHKITFIDVWSKSVPVHQLSDVKHRMITADEVKDEMYNSHALRDLIRMRNKCTLKQVQELLMLFFAEQETIQTKYNNEGQIKKHFIYWVPNNIEKIKSKPNVKSAGQILGKNK